MKTTNKELLTDVLNYIRFSKYCILNKTWLATQKLNSEGKNSSDFEIIIKAKTSQALVKELKKCILSEIQVNGMAFDRLQNYDYDRARVNELLFNNNKK